MELMEIRRGLMIGMASSGLRKKTFHVGQQVGGYLSLTHNLGVIPKFIVVMDDNSQSSVDDYALGEIYYFEAAPVENPVFQNQCNGVGVARNLASGRVSIGGYMQSESTSVANYKVTTTDLIIQKLISNSGWDIAPSYTIDLYY